MLYYYSYGKGDPIIILSGGPGVASHQEDDVAARLAMHYRVILFDQRGTGRSWTKPLDSTTINVDRTVEDLELLRKRIGIDKISLYGHSWGSMLAGAYTSRYPRHVRLFISVGGGELDRSLTDMVNANVALKTDQAKINYWRDPMIVKRDPLKAAAETRRLKVIRSIYHTAKIDLVLGQVVHGATNPAMAGLMWKDLQSRLHFVEGCQHFHGPTLIVFGYNDMIGLTTVRQYQKAFPAAQTAGIPKCGHYPEIEQPEAFYSIIENFLARNLGH